MSNLPVEIEAKVEKWLLGNYDETTKNILKDLKEQNDTTTLVDAFYKDLEFGTGGMRGIMGVGSNRINKYTIGMATQGLANYLLQCFPDETIKVAIAHDSRNQSDYFAQITANVFSANGIEVYFFDRLRPTPELSFAIRHLGCKSGVVLTASHNPKEYNGYKAYWTDGAQLVAPHDKNVIAEVQNIQVDDVTDFNLFSDVYKDQVNSDYTGLYMSKRFFALLERIHREDATTQHDILDTEIKEWQGDADQVDDIMVLGFKMLKS